MLTQEKAARAATLGPVVADLTGPSLSDADCRRLAHPRTGAVILFTRNFESFGQLAELCAEIHSIRPGILIAVDHEGGRVQRFREGFTQIPAMRELSRAANPTAAFSAAGFILASELRAAGVDFTFAPVLDVDYGRSGVIGNRALGGTPEEVTANACALTLGLRMGGMAACGKHFPGHGWAEADSHTALPEDDRPLVELERDLLPYRELFLAMPSIMTAHVAYRAYHGAVATYEPKLIEDVLRVRLGFAGLVFSDDLSMKGAVGARSPLERAKAALACGCDMVLHCNHPDEIDDILDGLSDASAWQRSAAFEDRLAGLLPEAGTPLAIEALRSSEQWRAARRELERAGFAASFAALS